MKKGAIWIALTVLMVTSLVLASCSTSTTTRQHVAYSITISRQSSRVTAPAKENLAFLSTLFFTSM